MSVFKQLLSDYKHALLYGHFYDAGTAYLAVVAEYQGLQSRLEELNQTVTALQQENASLKQDAERFRKLAYLMRFDKEGDYVTMDLVCPVDATSTHDVIGDWMEPAFTESVRRTVDVSM